MTRTVDFAILNKSFNISMHFQFQVSSMKLKPYPKNLYSTFKEEVPVSYTKSEILHEKQVPVES